MGQGEKANLPGCGAPLLWGLTAVDRLVELALDTEVAMWRKAEHDKGAGKAQQAYTQHVRSLYQHIRSDKTPWVRQQLLDNELIPEQLVEMTPSVRLQTSRPSERAPS